MNFSKVIRNLSSRTVWPVVAIFVLFLMLGCGSSRKELEPDSQQVNIDDLMQDESSNKADADSEEAEVLRLLGITPADNKQKEPADSVFQAQPTIASEPEATQLEEDLQQKDQQISTLRSELVQKETKISDLEDRLEGQTRPSPAPVRNQNAGTDFKSRYQYALSLFNARNYREALSSFRDLLATDSNNSLSDNCQYWIGECYYALGDYNQAITEFEKVFSFANSNKSDDAQLKLGICYLKLGNKQQARAEFERLVSNYPNSEYVDLAKRYINRL